MKSNSGDFKTYEQLYSLLRRYIRYCYSIAKERHNFHDWNINKMADEFVSRFETKQSIEYWFLKRFNDNKTKVLSPKSYYDLELKLSIRGY